MLYEPRSLVETVDALRQGRLNLIGYIERACDRLEQVNPRVEALLDEPARRERLLREADALQARYPQPASRPPLYGALVGVKDILRVDDLPTRGGSALPPELFAGDESAVVTRLREAGALVLGKTVTTEFAYFAPGPTRNPHNLAHTPGGSSSGSAAAVAAGLCTLAIGTQTIGSIIRPAAFCGVAGYKPTFGRVEREGALLISPSLDHIGLFAADSASIRLAASFICADWQEGDTPHRPTLGIPTGPYLDQLPAESRQAFETQVRWLEDAGYTVRRVPMFDHLDQMMRMHRRLFAGEMARQHHEWFARHETLYRPQTVTFIREGQGVSEAELAAARAAQVETRRHIETVMASEGIDLWASPSALGPAPAGIEATGDPAMSFPWTFTGLPNISLPAGRTDDNLPLGLQLAAGWMQDERLLAWAEGVEGALAAHV